MTLKQSDFNRHFKLPNWNIGHINQRRAQNQNAPLSRILLTCTYFRLYCTTWQSTASRWL